MKEALDKITAIRYRCNRQKTISTQSIVDDLLIIEKALHSANQTYNKLNKRAQKAETEVKRLKDRLQKLESI
ncbi:hypothetical protein D7X33_45725 [Butyricicoccus sp. 1XD8-22]|nr:hypothetical protein D7X33_45725 [Butyricicoccus sp. 1XD8-22]